HWPGTTSRVSTSGSCTCSLRLTQQPDKPGKMPSLQPVYEGRFCHGLASVLLPAHADRSRMAVRHAPVGVAERLRRRVPDTPGPSTPTPEAQPCAETL